MEKFAKSFCDCEVNLQKNESFLPRMISNIRYVIITVISIIMTGVIVVKYMELL